MKNNEHIDSLIEELITELIGDPKEKEGFKKGLNASKSLASIYNMLKPDENDEVLAVNLIAVLAAHETPERLTVLDAITKQSDNLIHTLNLACDLALELVHKED